MYVIVSHFHPGPKLETYLHCSHVKAKLGLALSLFQHIRLTIVDVTNIDKHSSLLGTDSIRINQQTVLTPGGSMSAGYVLQLLFS